MEGARVEGGVADRARAALRAGCDFVLVCNDTAAMDQVLDGLRWTPGPAFAERFARLAPKGPAPGPEALAASEVYRAAVRDLGALADE
jgi:beta-N-acetylhexosaminidase